MTDEMEGNLTRWLRFLGYDTRYAKDYESTYGSPVDDDDLIEQCFLEHRILITKDREMVNRFNKRYKKIIQEHPNNYLKFDITQFLTPSILLNSNLFVENMFAIFKKFQISLNYDSKIARCSKCNSTIKIIKDKKKFRDNIPNSVYQNIDKYWVCTNEDCKKIYWIGGHFKDILNKLTEIKEYI
ncbi:MAG: Mut7-C RNAse domain-containing protein [Promethearchaeota archaeon]